MGNYEPKYGVRVNDIRSEIINKYKELENKYATVKIPTASSKYLRKGQQADGRLKILGDER
jgi:hypothetical protein